MSLNDEIRRATGGGTIPDGLRSFYLANGATDGTLNDLERQFLIAQVGAVPARTNSDLWMAYLGGLGHTGTLNDRLLQFWAAQP